MHAVGVTYALYLLLLIDKMKIVLTYELLQEANESINTEELQQGLSQSSRSVEYGTVELVRVLAAHRPCSTPQPAHARDFPKN